MCIFKNLKHNIIYNFALLFFSNIFNVIFKFYLNGWYVSISNKNHNRLKNHDDFNLKSNCYPFIKKKYSSKIETVNLLIKTRPRKDTKMHFELSWYGILDLRCEKILRKHYATFSKKVGETRNSSQSPLSV